MFELANIPEKCEFKAIFCIFPRRSEQFVFGQDVRGVAEVRRKYAADIFKIFFILPQGITVQPHGFSAGRFKKYKIRYFLSKSDGSGKMLDFEGS